MDRLRRLWRTEQAYEPLESSITEADQQTESSRPTPRFSWLEYGVFLLLGVAMLWAWNMFLAAGPYFQQRFRESRSISESFQAAEISVSTVTNLGSMLILTRMQARANYPKRIMLALLINIAVFSLLAISTSLSTSAEGYFGFLIAMIFTTSLATGLIQNGIFAYVSGFGVPQYTQGIMTGQAVAGVLPCLAQIISVLSVQPSEDRAFPPDPPEDGVPSPERPPSGPQPVPATAALAYFLTATIISVMTLMAFFYLAARHRQHHKMENSDARATENDSGDQKKPVLMITLIRKLSWLAAAVIVTFGITMVFPVFTQRILSVRPPNAQAPLFRPPSFIPLAFLFWNAGDLLGRLMTGVPSLSLVRRPRVLFALAVCRVLWLGLYHLCNIRGQGAVVESDAFYLVIVQLFFGLTNGYLGSTCMIGANEWVEPDEREAAGGFMGLCLVAGLTIGSLASFFVTGI